MKTETWKLRDIILMAIFGVVFAVVYLAVFDGGMALYSLLCSTVDMRRAAWICTAVSVVFALLLGTLGFSLLLRTQYNFTLLLLALYILLYLVLKRRDGLC